MKNSAIATKLASPTKPLNPQVNTFSPTTTSSMYAGTSSGVLLQTARTQIYNPDGLYSSLEVRVILDSGSQKSYITQQVRDALSLNVAYRQKMSIKTFGSEKEEQQDCEVVKVAMKTVDGAFLDLLLFTVPLICEPLNNQPINFCNDEYDHLTHLTLADACDSGDMPNDILIGIVTNSHCFSPFLTVSQATSFFSL